MPARSAGRRKRGRSAAGGTVCRGEPERAGRALKTTGGRHETGTVTAPGWSSWALPVPSRRSDVTAATTAKGRGKNRRFYLPVDAFFFTVIFRYVQLQILIQCENKVNSFQNSVTIAL